MPIAILMLLSIPPVCFPDLSAKLRSTHATISCSGKRSS
jgi:hypothetical protein